MLDELIVYFSSMKREMLRPPDNALTTGHQYDSKNLFKDLGGILL